MCPQFADLNADGIADIIVGTYDGSPHISWGTAAGFGAPTDILTKDKSRILTATFWDYTKDQWNDATPGKSGYNGDSPHVTSAWLVDWDADGDLDLLLGDYHQGHLYLRMNEGTKSDAAFAAKNIDVLADGAPLLCAGGISTVRTFDWNGDGLFDLVIASMGDVYGDGPGGGLDVYLNGGTAKAPAFGKPVVVIPRSAKNATRAERPDTGLYMDMADIDGDGDFDLVVGGYAHEAPPAPVLSEADKKKIEELKTAIDDAKKRYGVLMAEVVKAVDGLPKDEASKKRAEVMKSLGPKIDACRAEMNEGEKALAKFIPKKSRTAGVWLYRNTQR